VLIDLPLVFYTRANKNEKSRPRCPGAPGKFVMLLTGCCGSPAQATSNSKPILLMSRLVFITLPVADLPKAMAFYKALGFGHNPDFSDDTGSCIVISDVIHVMLLTHAKFTSFTPKSICDTKTTTEVLLSLNCESREEVDGLVAKAVSAGGSTQGKPEDDAFMYQHDFSDLDGHQWGLFHMKAMPPQ
jgi:predicted lactoylglutathione lyase